MHGGRGDLAPVSAVAPMSCICIGWSIFIHKGGIIQGGDNGSRRLATTQDLHVPLPKSSAFCFTPSHPYNP